MATKKREGKSKINIAIAEDHNVVLDGYASLLKGHPRINILFNSNNGKELIRQLKVKKPDIVLLDIEMPVMGGKAALEVLKKRFPKIKVIVISSYFHNSFVIDFINNGASGFLPKECNFKDIEQSIIKVAEKGSHYNNVVAEIMERAKAEDLLKGSGIDVNDLFTKTELRIIKLLCEEKTSIDIGSALSMTKRTVDWYRQKIMQKAKCSSFSALIIFAVTNKLN